MVVLWILCWFVLLTKSNSCGIQVLVIICPPRWILDQLHFSSTRLPSSWHILILLDKFIFLAHVISITYNHSPIFSIYYKVLVSKSVIRSKLGQSGIHGFWHITITIQCDMFEGTGGSLFACIEETMAT